MRLVIVDFQKDFYSSEEGSLYVKGAEECVPEIIRLINEENVESVIFTVDWHRIGDESFACNGGQWPVHCVQFSEGASIHPEILKAVVDKKIPYSVFVKGNDSTHEEYGAFERPIESSSDTFVLCYNHLRDCAEKLSKGVEYKICGLAGDYCVWETYKNLKKFGINVNPFYPGISFIGDAFDYDKKIKEC